MNSAIQIIRLLEKVEKEQRELDNKQELLNLRRERLLKELAERVESPNKFIFRDSELSVSWAGGRLQFRKGAFSPYVMLQALFQAENKRLSHAEIADIVYDDDCAPIRDCARGLRDKLEQSRCPLRLEHDSSAYWLSEY